MSSEGFPRLVGDVGGTNARWAWQAAPGAGLHHYAAYRCADYASPAEVIERYLVDQNLPAPKRVAFGIATPIAGDRVTMTNHAWSFSIAELQARLGVERCLVLNDFAALAGGLSALTPAELRRVGGGDAVAGAPMAVLGAGTGLGVASVVSFDMGAGKYREVIVAGEGGHVTLAACNDREAAVIDALHRRFGHASAERALSGPGLVNLYSAVCELDGLPDAALQPADVSARALHGGDAACSEAMSLFGAFMGTVAGNLALTLGAHGGVFIGGGIVPRMGTGFDALPFRERFDAKGRFRSYLENIPVWVITAAAPGLYGAAAALD